MRRGDVHLAANRHVMYAEGTFGAVVPVAGRFQRQRDILEVISLSGIHLHGLVDYLTAVEPDGPSVAGKRHAIDVDLRALGVASFFQIEEEIDAFLTAAELLLPLVGHGEVEDGGFVHRHVAALMDVDIDLLVLQIQRTVAERDLRRIVMRGVGRLPRTAAGTAVQVIDERTVLVVRVLLPDVRQRGVRLMIEALLFQGTIDTHVHIAVLVRAEGKARFAGMRFAVGRFAMDVQIEDRRQLKHPLGFHRLGRQQIRQFLISANGRRRLADHIQDRLAECLLQRGDQTLSEIGRCTRVVHVVGVGVGVFVHLAVTHLTAAAHRPGAYVVPSVAVDGVDLLFLVLDHDANPSGDGAVVPGHLIRLLLGAVRRTNLTVRSLRSEVVIRRHYLRPVEDFVLRIRHGLYGGAVQRQQQSITVALEFGNQGVLDKIVRIGKRRTHVRTHFALQTDDQVPPFTVRFTTAVHHLHRAVCKHRGKRLIGERVDGLDRVR